MTIGQSPLLIPAVFGGVTDEEAQQVIEEALNGVNQQNEIHSHSIHDNDKLNAQFKCLLY